LANEALRLRGEEIQIRVISGSNVVTSLTSISNFTDTMLLEIKQDGFIGENFDRFDDIFSGYKGGFEMQPNTSEWYDFQERVRQRATREDPTLVFNIIKTMFFANGQTVIITFKDVKWGEIDDSTGGRKEYAKVKWSWSCSERDLHNSGLI
jgi:hypothetical protein